MTNTQTANTKTSRNDALAMLKARTAQQSTATLCETIVLLAGMPSAPETNLTRAVVLGVLCERHPEAEDAAEDWAEDDSIEYSIEGYAAVICDAALKAIGA